MNSNERFEVINDLYFARHGKLRPGKDSFEEDSSSEENRARFDNWIATGAFSDALERIKELESELKDCQLSLEYTERQL